MPRVNVMSQPNVDNTGQTPCHTQIQAAINAAGPNGIVYFPTGKYLITQPLVTYVSNTQGEGGVSLQGDGWQSAIIVKLADPGAVAFTLNNSALASPLQTGDPAYATAPQYRSRPVEGLEWSDIAILGGWTPGTTQGTRVACCHTGLQMDLVLRSSFRNVHVLLAASHHCVYMRAGWSNHYGFISSAELGQRLYGALPGYPASTYAEPPAVTHIRGGPNVKYVGGLNANTYDCLVEGGSSLSSGATLLAIEDQYTVFRVLKSGTWEDTDAQPQGNNLIRGTYEGTRPETTGYTGYGIHLGRSYQPSIRDFHVEHTGGILIENCDSPTVEQGVVQDVALAGTTGAFLDQVTVSNLAISETCSFIRLGAIGLEGAVGLNNRSGTTVSLGSIRDLNEKTVNGERVRQTAAALANPENLVQNGDFSRWVGGVPEGWKSKPGTWTATPLNPQTPTVPAALATRSTTCALYSATGTTTADVVVSLDLPRPLRGVWIACSAWIFIPTDSALASVELNLLRDGQGAEIQSGQLTGQKGAWARLQTVFWAHPSVDTNSLVLHGTVGSSTSAPRTFYIADVQANVGLTSAAHTFVPAANAADTYQLAGRRISYGTAKPSGGTALVGDIVYNAAPAAGQPVGWVCTAAPATWNGFGIIQTT